MPRGDRSTGTREALLEAAEGVFLLRGPYGATVREIAEAAGVTVPAVYYHFEGVEQLYGEVLRTAQARFREAIERALGGRADLRARLRAIAGVYVEFGRAAPGRLRLLCGELFRPRRPDEPDHGMEGASTWLRATIEGVMADGISAGRLHGPPPVARRLFTALLNGLLLEQARDPATLFLDDALAERVVGTFLDGMGNGEVRS